MKLLYTLIILCAFSSSILFSSNSTEYSIGLNDKIGYFGPFSTSWIKEKDNKDSYTVVGGLGIIGGVGVTGTLGLDIIGTKWK